jgi:uncharacterized protein (TIGR00375 family)
MKIFADLHLHSKYSRATSDNLNLEYVERYGKIKGLNLAGTGDFQHPLWFKELKENLKETDKEGFFFFNDKDFSFILQTEVSNIYEQDGKSRRIHNIILCPSFDVAEQIIDYFKPKGKLESDGRPIFAGLGCAELTENLMQISRDIAIIPAHAWTPWYGVFGSKTGFDSLKECFKDQVKHIFAIETGLSSNPAMNWRLSELDNIALVSNSDCHSPWPWRLGRELNVFELDKPSYKSLIEAIKSKDKNKFLFTVEVDPNYGKYHWDGHRNCDVSLEPKEAIRYKNICPVCRRPLTVGVLHRLEELADREEGYIPKEHVPFKTMLPLSELIATIYNTEPFSKKVWEEHNKLIKVFETELNILLNIGKERLVSVVGENLAELLIKNREGLLKVQPGYDGVYGKILLTGEISKKLPQKTLDSFLLSKNIDI